MYVDANSQAFVRAISQYDNLRSFTTPMKRMTRKLVGRDKEMRSVSAAMERAELSNVILLADAGSGKLLPLDTPIPTPTGWTTMGALRPGDMVVGRDGKPTMVTFTSEVDKNPELYELEFSDGTKQVACVDHQWLVSDVTQRNYGNASHSAVDVRAEERSRGYLDVMLEHDDVEYVTVRELVELIADVPYNTWHSHNSLLQYLLGCGVSHKDVVFEERQSWKGMTRLIRVHREMVSLPESLRALASQPRRARHGSDERVMTTGDMLRAGLVTASGRRRFSVKMPRPLDLPEADLPVDPYVLGVWLGDGHSHIQKSACITSADVDMMRWVEAAGYPVCRIANDNAGAANTYTFVGLGDGLASIGMSEGKHIPIEYLRASYDQRLALLQGIMDTDGSISSVGTAAISLSDERLASDVEELIHTLGIKVVRHVSDSSYRDADGNIVKCRDRHRMTFTTTQQIFRLSRKACRIPKEVRKTQERLYLVGIRPVKSVAGKCIQVANTDHVYLCGKNFLPTHNTALVQGLMERDENRIFLEVDLSRMIAAAKNPDEIGNMLKGLFDEASRFGREQGHDIVLFMDEFHQIVQLSAAAVEALKPLLADSATRGIRVIAATTYEEFRRYISDNQPLVERLQRINVPEPDKETTVEILRGMAERYGVADDIIGNALYEAIYDVTQRHIPANAQPRKSILVLDAMVGWHRAEHKQFNNKLLADVIFESEGINIAFSVDSQTIKRELDKHVLAQTYATRVVEERLQLCVAGLNDQSKPQSSFLLCGPTGVGKTELTKQLSKLLFGDATRSLIRIDMSEYANPDSLERFRLEITARVWEHPYCIVLLDEVEKACPEVTRVLLSVLDDARLSDRNGREVSFLNCYFVLTTNAGNEIYRTIAQYEADDSGDGSFLARYDRLIRRSLTASTGGVKFPPELLGRIDCIVPFQPLSYNTMRQICVMRLRELRRKLLDKYSVDMSVENRVVTYLVEDSLTTDSDAGGARAVMAKLEGEVTTAIARFINMHPDIRNIHVEIEGELASENKTRITSDACVKIKGVVG